MRYHCILPLLAAGAIAVITPASAQTNATPTPATPTTTIKLSKDELAKLLKGLPKSDLLNDRAYSLLNTVLETGKTNEIIGLINDLNLRPKIFGATDGEDDSVLGLEFRYEKSVANRVINEAAANPMGVSFAVKAQGDLAINADDNPNDLLEFSGGFHLFQGIGGINPTLKSTEEAAKALFAQSQAAALGDTNAEAQATATLRQFLKPQFFWDVQAQGGLETDQRFRDKQWLYGLNAAFVFREWRDTRVGWFNVLDYPFALTRWIFSDADFRPSGRTFPSVALGVDMVDPSSNDSRLDIDPDSDPYARFRAEVAFKTPMVRWREDWLYVSAAFRFFQEIDASSLIEAAGEDQSDFFVIKFDLPYNLNVSYSNGALPIDQENDQVFALGWAVNF